jgi:hypothetical protein
MNRRKFISKAAAGLGAACVTQSAFADLLDTSHRAQATDTVVLGKTGIRTSRLAMGTGTIGAGGSSNQTRAGSLTQLLRTATIAASLSSIPPTPTAPTRKSPKQCPSSRARKSSS